MNRSINREKTSRVEITLGIGLSLSDETSSPWTFRTYLNRRIMIFVSRLRQRLWEG
jgi:hypothetical protein